MRIGRAALWAAGAAAAIVAGTAAWLLTFDIEAYRDEVARAVSAATGRSATVAGRLSLTPSLRPRLTAQGVALGNPPGFSRPEMIRIERLEAQANLWPLLMGRVEIDHVTLSGVDLLLERDASGAGNWQFESGEGSAGGGLPRIHSLTVRDSRIGWRTGDEVLALELARLEAAQQGDDIVAELEGAVEGRPLALRGRVTPAPPRSGDAGPVVLVRELALRFDELAGEGELTLILAPERPRIDGRLALEALDLDRMFGGGGSAQDGRLLPDAPLDPAPLSLADAALRFSAASLVAGGVRLTNVAGTARLEAGRLELTEFAADLAQGKLSAAGEAQGRGGRLAARLRADLAQAELAELLPDAGLGGRIDAKADLKGEGDRLRALVASLAGEARLIGRDGRIAGRALDLAAADLVRLLAPWSERGSDTRISCMLFAATVRQGRAQTDALVVDADRVLVTGEGTIDLGRERLDLKLTPRPKDPSLFSLATPVNVRGPLADPGISPDEVGLVRGAAGALLGNLVLPGAGVLLPFLSAGAGDHPCAAVLDSGAKSAAGGKAAAPKPAKQEGGVGGFFRDVGRSIDRALGAGR